MVTAGILPFRENSHGRTGNRTRDLMISSQRLWPLHHEAGPIENIRFKTYVLSKYSNLLQYDVTSAGKYLQTFRRIILSPSSEPYILSDSSSRNAIWEHQRCQDSGCLKLCGFFCLFVLVESKWRQNVYKSHHYRQRQQIQHKKAVPLQAWRGPEGSRKLRFPHFVTTAQDGGRLSALRTGRLYLQEMLLVLISIRGWVDLRTIVRLEGFWYCVLSLTILSLYAKLNSNVVMYS